MRHISKQETGFTVLEVLVVIICAVILLAIVYIMHS